ncbi:asparaginase [Corynebacterium sp. NML140438]|uniref:asparaginase n=1 Tax=Corynebacterium sp. NML140438 TaxID=1906334 RepID=UPI0008FB67A7|nr:asparaginase [Corynebacterium sp. NML140438]
MSTKENATLPRIGVGALGGTIAMAEVHSEVKGAQPAFGAEQLISAIPAIKNHALIDAKTIANVASPSVTIGHILEAKRFAEGCVQQGAAGVVLTHGTDTLEETAFLLDLLWAHSQPLIVTGAMRTATAVSADGPANLYNSILAAADPTLRDFGVCVCLDDAIFQAKSVTKTDANTTWTFQSPSWGPIARILEENIRTVHQPRPNRQTIVLPEHPEPIDIPILEIGIDTNPEHLSLLAATSPQGIVLSCPGMGHIPERMIPALEQVLQQGIPVVVATRSPGGSTGTHTYSYPGAEVDLINRGAVLAGFISARKARLLLWAALQSGTTNAKLTELFKAIDV